MPIAAFFIIIIFFIEMCSLHNICIDAWNTSS